MLLGPSRLRCRDAHKQRRLATSPIGGAIKSNQPLPAKAGSLERLKVAKFLRAEAIIIQRGFLALRLAVLLDRLVSQVARVCSEVAPCPETPPPELAIKFTKLFQHPTTTPPLGPFHQFAHRYLRRYRHQRTHVVNRRLPTQYVHIQRRTRLSGQLGQPPRYIAAQHRQSNSYCGAKKTCLKGRGATLFTGND